jgi:carboxyl-terminal processing protease
MVRMKFYYGLAAAVMGVAASSAIVAPKISYALTPTEVSQLAKQFTVLIEGTNSGSGAIVKREGNTYYVLTANQVVEGAGKQAIVTPDGRRYQLNYATVRQLPSRDLALVQFTSNQNYRVADLGDAGVARLGTAVYVAGFPKPTANTGGNYQFTEGKIFSRPAQNQVNGYALNYTNATRSGMSGGPVLNEEGRLIGIHRQAENQALSSNVGLNLGIPINGYRQQIAQLIEPPRSIAPQIGSTPSAGNAQAGSRRIPALFVQQPNRVNINGVQQQPNRVNINGAQQQPNQLNITGAQQLVDEVWQVVNRQYVDATFNNVDWQQVRREYVGRSYNSQEDAYKAVRDMLKKLNDPYTRFLDPKAFRDLQSDTSGQLTGVGLQLAQDEKTKKLVVIAPIEDTPAAKAGIIAKDGIVKIDDKGTEGMDANQAAQLIRGQAGTLVTLTIQRGDKQLVVPLRRARIEIHPVRYSYQNNQLGGIGYIRLSQFSANAPKEMNDAIQNLEKQRVNGYILDLRSNPGGLLGTSIEIARMWIDSGTIVSTATRQGQRDRRVAINSALTNKPLVVLVDGGSASASEILSGALQDNKRAVLVGAKTFGKGLVQSVQPLLDGSGMAVTIAKYFTPAGRDINKSGIQPDVVLELTEQQKEALSSDRTKLGTPSDPQYALALETLRQQIAQRGNRAESISR